MAVESIQEVCAIDTNHLVHPTEFMQELYSGTSVHSTHFIVYEAGIVARYFTTLGFNIVGYSGRESGNHQFVSYILKQGDIIFVFSSPLFASDFSRHSQSPAPNLDLVRMQHFLKDHGSGAWALAMRITDIERKVEASVANGAKLITPPTEVSHDNGSRIRYADIQGLGDMSYLLIEEITPSPNILPGYVTPNVDIHPHVTVAKDRADTGLYYIDHQVINVQYGLMNPIVDYHQAIFGAKVSQSFNPKVPDGSQVLESYQQDSEGVAVGTDLTALSSRVTRIGTTKDGYEKHVVIPVNEPFPGDYVDQILEMVEIGGDGLQHIALGTRDIFATIDVLKASGLQFLEMPEQNYYDVLEPLIVDKEGGLTQKEWDNAQRLGILIDVENWEAVKKSHEKPEILLQIFTMPLFTEPRLFIEIIERRGGKGFGGGNFNQLWGGIEKLQDVRGHLVKTPSDMKSRIIESAKICK